MSLTKEILWSFSCDECSSQWSIKSTDKWKPNTLYCTHCNHVHKYNMSTPIDEKSVNIVTYDSDDGYTIDYRMDEIRKLEDIQKMKENNILMYNKNVILRKNVFELQQQLQRAYKRIKTLIKRTYSLRKEIREDHKILRCRNKVTFISDK